MKPQFAAIFFFAATVLAAPTVTIEDLLAPPFPTNLIVAPDGTRAAWVANAEGARNVWVADAPDFRGRMLTAYAADDGIDIGQLAFTPDGQSIVYTRGGDLEFLGADDTNPAHAGVTPEQAIWIVSIADGAQRKFADGNSPAISPSGDRVAYIAKRQLWIGPADGKTKPEAVITAPGSRNDLRWSPDGTRLAFVASRREHNFIGVFDTRTKMIRYVDPGVDRDVSPIWSPDGRKIAFIRIPSRREPGAFAENRSGLPWSIRVGDADTGGGRELWHADSGVGSVFRGVESDDSLIWGAGDQIVFPWEKDGWTHLYAISAAGGAPRLLTPGEFEVEYVSASPDRREIIYNSNQNDIDRRHLWKVAVSGGAPVAVTKGNGIEWEPHFAGSSVVFLRSDARMPPRPAVVAGANPPRDMTAIPSRFPAAQLVEPQQVIFAAADGMKIHGQLFLPPGGEGKHPAAVFFHGGSRRQMLLGWHYMNYYHNAYAMNQYLASRGYVVLSVNYRSGIGYGMQFREAEKYGTRGASEVNDVIGAGLYLRSRADVDPDRIAAWGGSYGGYLTAFALAKASNLYAAGVDMHGVHDWNNLMRQRDPAFDFAGHEEQARTAWESSPLAHVDSWRSPVLLIQGDDDRNVSFTETIHLAEALRKRNVEVELLIFPDEIHDFLLHKSWLAAYHATADFLDRKLQPQRIGK